MTAKHVSNSPVTFVTRERFAVLWRKLTNYKGLALKMSAVELLRLSSHYAGSLFVPAQKAIPDSVNSNFPRPATQGKNNGFPFLDIFGYLKNTHKNPKLGKVRQVPAREFPTKFPDWDLSHSSKFGIFALLGIFTCNITFRDLKIRQPDGNENVKKQYV